MTSVLTVTEQRLLFESRLNGLVQYLYLKEDTKRPRNKYSLEKHRFNHIPKKGSYGVYPINKTVILDFDNPKDNKALSPLKQLQKFAIDYDVDLSEALYCLTPSGGVHLYLTWPENFPLPKNKKLKLLDSQYCGDIRAAGTNGYVVGVGSKKIKDNK